MPVEFDKKDLAKYPFLKEAASLVSGGAYSIDNLFTSIFGGKIIEKAKQRIMDAVNANYVFENVRLDFPEYEILSYAVSRLIVSCLREQQIIDKLCRYESERASYYLRQEAQDKKAYVAASLGIPLQSDKMKLSAYVSLAASLRDAKWQLVNREVSGGYVTVSPEEMDDLIKERVRYILHDQLPLPVTEELKEKFSSFSEEISAQYRQKIMEQFGEVDEDSFPPCMKAIIRAVSEGTNIPHTARFSLTAFLHTIGMGPNEIITVFMRAPDFNVDMTQYQVEHISGRSGVEYNPPQCATMKTYGLCVPDSFCRQKNFAHPLGCYTSRKRAAELKNAASKKGNASKTEKTPENAASGEKKPVTDRHNLNARIEADEKAGLQNK